MADVERCGPGLEFENLHPFVRDLRFPARRDEIISHARDRGAGPDLIQYLSNLPEREFGNLEEISKACASTTH